MLVSRSTKQPAAVEAEAQAASRRDQVRDALVRDQ
jgi:hypothetical protein